MGMFAWVTVSNEIELPHFPSAYIDRSEMSWQSKQGIDRYGGPYRITADGRLEEQQEYYRDKTDEEKQAEASKWGFDSWDAFIDAYENDDSGGFGYPDAVDYDRESEDSDGEHPPVYPSEKILAYKEWEDVNKHGTMEFHSCIQRDPLGKRYVGDTELPDDYKLDVFIEYEVRFTEGNLDEIVFMGERFGDEPVESIKRQINEWKEWKEQNE